MTLVLGGRDVTGFRGIKYTEKIEREALHAKGRYAHSIQSGNVSYEGEMYLLQDEYEALVLAGGGSLLRLRGLVAVVGYGNPADGDAVLTKTIEGIYFTDATQQMKQGDKFMEMTLPFLALRVR
jgi:hypothetical protein